MRAHARSAMNELSGVLGACATLEDGQAALVRHLAALFPEGSGCLYWCCGDGKEAASLVSWGAESGSASTMTFDQCLALRQGQPHHLRLGVSAPACAHLLRVPGGGAVCAPLNLGERLAGLLYWEGPHLPDTVDEALAIERDTAWRQWTCAVAEYLGLALSNLALRHTLQIQARHDPLTDLFNRRYMEEALERELRRADRSRRPMGVIMADLDHFKRYNDTLGHDAGDRLLVALAECLRAQVRAGDIVCRYGGEEFLIILPETSLDLVTQRAEELRETVARQLGSFGGDAVPPVTMSLGVALYPIHAGDAASLIRAADAAMYRAKRSGRNRVEIAETGESTPPPQNDSMSATSNSR
ncbi:MAG: GGDEF domain-containing protein [Burkholderiales bacterium]|nr:GGDEF domain-containing protein [Burkholderiales bacterium]